MSPQNTDLQLDPSITPYTWHLDNNFRKFAELHMSGKKYDDEHDNVCFPGHSLVIDTTEILFSLGRPGFDMSEMLENNSDDNWFDILSRGLTSPDHFASFLPSVGKYILYLWLLRTLIKTGMSEWPSEKMPFKYECSDNGLQSYPGIDCLAIGLEWHWINEFLILSDTLCEPDLDLIPGFWTGSREATIDHPQWKEIRLMALGAQPHLPYNFRQVDAGTKAGKILATPQNKNLRLFMLTMAELEKLIHQTVKNRVMPTWKKMRSQGVLSKDQMDETLLTRFNWQIGQWPDVLMKDGKLHATVAHATYTGDHKSDYFKIWKGDVRKSLDKLNKRRDDIRPGKSQTKTALDPKAISLIMELGSDLVKILDVAWPIDKKVEPGTGIRELKKQVKILTLKKIRANHFNFSWEKIHDRLDFPSKIVAEYLEDITGNRYKISILRKPIQDILFKTSCPETPSKTK